MTVAVDFEGEKGEKKMKEGCMEGVPGEMDGAAQRGLSPSASARSSSQLSGDWHLRLATLLMTLRGCLLGPDRDFFDSVHTSAHRREIPTHHFFQYALNILRQHKPELEDEFREVIRLRNASRRRARQLKNSTLRSVKSEPMFQDFSPPRGGMMSRSCEDVAAQARSVEEVDETIFRLQALCVEASSSEGRSVLAKRHSEISMCDTLEQKRKSCHSGDYRIASPSWSSP